MLSGQLQKAWQSCDEARCRDVLLNGEPVGRGLLSELVDDAG
jgi:hypothetical protein